MRGTQRTVGRPRLFKEPRQMATTVEKDEKTRLERISKRKGKTKSELLRDLAVAEIAREEGLAQNDEKESE